MAQTAVIIVAGGGGKRMGGKLPKQFLLLAGKPVLAHTINTFAEALPGAQLLVVLPAAYTDFWRNLAARFDVAPHSVIEGGQERFHSVQQGLAAVAPDAELIAVQDAVRPFGSIELIRHVAEAAATHGAAIPVVEPVDSLRAIDSDGSHPLDRSRLRCVQTPQLFQAPLLREAYTTPYCAEFTDDASVVEHCGHPIFLCEGERLNLKITTPEDLLFAEALLAARNQPEETDDSHEELL